MKEFTVDLKGVFFLSKKDIEDREYMPSLYGPIEGRKEMTAEDVAAEFRTNGFNVTAEAVEHNAQAWKRDYKSGYRDEENGYHLFSPCGCNALYFTATELTEDGKSWQETYIA